MVSNGDMPAKSVVIEALLLAFSNSRVREIVSTDALRDVLEIEYREIVEDGTFDLQQVWELLEEQPGFAPELANPPLSLFKTWEEKLAIEVVLPDHLVGKSHKDLLLEASECPVGPHELQRILGKVQPQGHGRAAPVRDIPQPTSSPMQERRSWRQSPILLAGAIVLALGTFGFTGYHLKQGCAGPQWHELSAAQFAGDLPVRKARRIGAEVGAEISDPEWVGLDDEVRRSQLETALSNLSSKDIDSLFVTDEAGTVLATAQYFDEPRRIRVRFR